jgi:Predicted membrane protein
VTAGLEVLEVSVVVFLLQGYLTSGREALVRTLRVSGLFALGDTLVKIVYIYGFHVPLFAFGYVLPLIPASLQVIASLALLLGAPRPFRDRLDPDATQGR